MTPDYSPMLRWVDERERVRLAKESGLPPPWTDDPVISKYRFCNVRREDDRGTVWVGEFIREPFAGWAPLWFMLCIARQINWPDTLGELMARDAWPSSDDFIPRHMAEVLNDRKARGLKVYTGAYMISAPAEKGADKQSYICETVLGALYHGRHAFDEWFAGRPTLAGTHALLTRYNGWGAFMAYQAVVDMRFTALLCDAPDVATWAAAGPGTLRGLNRLHGRDVTAGLSQFRALEEMRAIYPVIQEETGVALDFSDVPNVLCETDKYLRVLNGEGTPRTLYVPGRGS